MIELHSMYTPNGRKAAIMLEELEVPYEYHAVNIMKGDQHKPAFLAISPNNKIPAIVDTDGPGGQRVSVFESGAILVYLAEKYGKFMPKDPVGRAQTMQWLFMQVGSVGPMFGQAGHFLKFAKEDIPYAKNRYMDETKRILGVLDRRLAQSPFLAGDEYTIADIATVPWIKAFDFYGVPEIVQPFKSLTAWTDKVMARPGVQRGWNPPG